MARPWNPKSTPPLPARFPIFARRDGPEGNMLEDLDREVERLIGRPLTTRTSPEPNNQNTQSRPTRRPLRVRRNEEAIPPTQTPEMQRLSPIVPNAPIKQRKASKKIDLRPKKLQYTEPEEEHPDSIDSGFGVEKKSQSTIIKDKPCSKEKEITRVKWLESRKHRGLWIECSSKTCRKWRFTELYSEPSAVPEKWYCRMNDDVYYSSCSIPQEKIPKKIKDTLIEAKYGIGGLVWARMDGFPWWPAMIEDCPIELWHYKLKEDSIVPFKYHVVFLGRKDLERAWIYDKDLKAYAKNRRDVVVKTTIYKSIDYEKQLDKACVLASQAAKLPVLERLKKYGWYNRATEENPTVSMRLRKRGTKCPTVKTNNLTVENANTSSDEESMEIKYNISDIVWARPTGYPWWPAMIDNCPFRNEYYKLKQTTSGGNKYHLIYFNEKKFETDWRTERELKIYRKNPRHTVVKRIKFRNTDYTEELNDACILADVAESRSREDRLQRFGSIARFPDLSQESVSTPDFIEEANSPIVVPEIQNDHSQEILTTDANLSNLEFTSYEEIRWKHYERENALRYARYNASSSQSSRNFEETGSQISETSWCSEEIPLAASITEARYVPNASGSVYDESSMSILEDDVEGFMDVDISPVISDQWPFDSGVQYDFDSGPIILSSDKTSSENNESLRNSFNFNQTISQSSSHSTMSLMDFFSNFKSQKSPRLSNN